MAQLATNTLVPREPRRDLFALQSRGLPPGYSIKKLNLANVERLHALATSAIGCEIATLATFERVLRRQPDLTYVLIHNDTQELRGFYALLLLSVSGSAAAKNDRFVGVDPSVQHLAVRGERGAALYSWVSVARRLSIFAVPLILDDLAGRGLGHLDIYSRPGSEAGRRIMSNLGFRPAMREEQGNIGELLVYRRNANVHVRHAA